MHPLRHTYVLPHIIYIPTHLLPIMHKPGYFQHDHMHVVMSCDIPLAFDRLPPLAKACKQILIIAQDI